MPNRFLFRLLTLLALTLAAALPARGFETAARAAWVFDLTSQTVLLAKNADESLPPASMSKLMTLNMLFEALRDGRVTLDTPFQVSARAKAMGGSTMFLTERDRPTVEDLIRGIIVQSGNDACVVVAEGLAGSEEAFVAAMNVRAAALGMTQSSFANSSGWPDPDQRMSMHDLGILAVRLIEEFPEYYGYFSMSEFAYDGRAPENHNNRNPLLKLGIGADGLKTGHTSEAGYGLAGSAVQGGRRVVFVITGLTSEAERSSEAERIVNWAFRQFAQKTYLKSGETLGEVAVFMGRRPTVGLTVSKDLVVLVPALVQAPLKGEIIYDGPLIAPIAAGAEIARLRIEVPGLAEVMVPLVAAEDLPRGGFLTRIKTATAAVSQLFGGAGS